MHPMKISLLVLILLIFSNCEKKKNFTTQLNKSQYIAQGDWISTSDSLSGISIRANYIAFFKNWEFNSDDIYNYKIIDSVEVGKSTKRTLSTYLIMYTNIDTVKYQILNQNNSTITLKLKENEIELYKLKDNHPKN